MTIVTPELKAQLTPNDRWHVEMFERFLRGDRDQQVFAWATGEPMSDANDHTTYGMGC